MFFDLVKGDVRDRVCRVDDDRNTILCNGVITNEGYFAISAVVTSREDIPMSTVFAPIAWIPTPDPPPDIWMSASGWVAMYWSAAFWTIGRTVVEPLILMVCFWPVETGAFGCCTGAVLS